MLSRFSRPACVVEFWAPVILTQIILWILVNFERKNLVLIVVHQTSAPFVRTKNFTINIECAKCFLSSLFLFQESLVSRIIPKYVASFDSCSVSPFSLGILIYGIFRFLVNSTSLVFLGFTSSSFTSAHLDSNFSDLSMNSLIVGK